MTPVLSPTILAFKRALGALLGAATLTFGLTGSPALAQAYPTQVVKIVVPFTAGGGADLTARLMAEQLGPRLGQSVIVENRPGASAGLGALSVARSTPNGYTLLFGTATLAANSLVSPTANLDVVNDFEFIGQTGQIDLLLVTSPQLRVNDLRGLLDMMRSRPLSYGSPGIGSPAHLGVELLKIVTKTPAEHVPYKGESAAVTDLLGGHVHLQLCGPQACGPRVRDGSLKALAVASKHRSKLLPNVPTMAEAGAAGVEAGTWFYLAAPKGTPAAVVAKLNTALNEVLGDEKVKTRLLDMGVEVEPGTSSAAVKSGLQAEIDKWRPVVNAAGIKN